MTRLASGTMLAGYRIERFLGQGGMGIVYLASQLSLDRPIALKLIAPERARDPGFRERFLRESHLAASLDHPHVVPVHEAGEDDGVLFVAMRFVDGCDLGALLRTEGALDPERAARIVAQVGAALDAAHARGLVHRDVKPANVLVADPGGAEHCYLTDFGLTKQTAAATDLTQTGAVMGTAHYIAPEQLRGGDVDGRADVYALGCVLFELLTGHPPFVRDTDVATLFAHLSQVPPTVDGPFDDVVQRALAKDPAERFQSTGGLGRAALDAAAGTAAGVTVVTPPVAAAPSTRRRRRPRRGVVLVAASLLVAVAVASAVLLRGAGGGLRVAQQVELGGIPHTATLLDGRIWITLEDEARLAVLDPRSGKLTQTADLGGTLSATAAGEGQLWVGDYGAIVEDGKGAVLAFDPRTGRAGKPTSTIEPYELVADDTSVWLSDQSEFIQRVDARSGKADAPIRVERPFDLVLAGDQVWVAANGLGQLIPFDARTGQPDGRPVSVGARPLAAATADGVIWVVTEPGRLVRVVPGEARTTAEPIGPPDPLRNVAASKAGVWVVDGTGAVTLADAANPSAQASTQVGVDLLDAEPYGIGAWVLRAATGKVSTASYVVRD